jgi:hypothetical protein
MTYKNHFHRESNSGAFVVAVAFVLVISSSKKQLWICRSYIVLLFRPTEKIFIQNRTQDTFSGLWPFSVISSSKKNNFGLGAVLQCLVSELQETSSQGIRIQDTYPKRSSYCVLFLASRNERAKLGENRTTPFPDIRQQTNINTYKHTHTRSVNFLYKTITLLSFNWTHYGAAVLPLCVPLRICVTLHCRLSHLTMSPPPRNQQTNQKAT